MVGRGYCRVLVLHAGQARIVGRFRTRDLWFVKAGACEGLCISVAVRTAWMLVLVFDLAEEECGCVLWLRKKLWSAGFCKWWGSMPTLSGSNCLPGCDVSQYILYVVGYMNINKTEKLFANINNKKNNKNLYSVHVRLNLLAF